MDLRRTQTVKITRADAVAELVVRLACDLTAGRENAGSHIPDVQLRLRYYAGWGDHLGEWRASIPVAPASERDWLADANGNTADEAIQNLLGVVQGIPLVAWD